MAHVDFRSPATAAGDVCASTKILTFCAQYSAVLSLVMKRRHDRSYWVYMDENMGDVWEGGEKGCLPGILLSTVCVNCSQMAKATGCVAQA